jgi:hypothetical protein
MGPGVRTMNALRVAVLFALCSSGCAVSSSGEAEENEGTAGKGAPITGMNPLPGANNPTPNAPVIMGCAGPCEDFPAAPIFDTEGPTPPPANAAALFGEADDFAGPGPCVIEPQLSVGDTPGALFPRNWLQPRFRFVPAAGETVWEIRLSAPMQKNELVAYTTRTTWPMPREIWRSLTAHSADTPVTVTIRGAAAGGGRKSGTRGTFVIAPVEARGKMVYWATTSSEVQPNTSKLVGFDVGDESVIDALTVPQAGNRAILAAGGRELRGMHDDAKGVPAGHVQCIGCHVSTPDGAAVAFTDHWPWNAVLASVEEATVGALPSYVTPGAERLLNQPWLGMQTFSKAHWEPGNRIVVVAYSPRSTAQSGLGFSDSPPYPSRGDRLAWLDLETAATFAASPEQGDVQQLLNQQLQAQLGSAFGLLALDGETRSVAAPSFSHDGARIAYTSAEVTQDGRLGPGREADLHMVPFNNRQGGTVAKVAGASEPGVAEYYPAFSADDRLLAFNRVQSPDGGPLYYRPDGEVYVVPSDGGTATRLLANDPPACAGEISPGVINSWPKWSPSVMNVSPIDAEFGPGVRTYYWLIFSSARAYPGQFVLPKTQYSPQDTRSSQLYMTAVVHNQTGSLSTYPAVYLWNQDASTSNLTPAWDEFKIPPVPGPD